MLFLMNTSIYTQNFAILSSIIVKIIEIRVKSLCVHVASNNYQIYPVNGPYYTALVL